MGGTSMQIVLSILQFLGWLLLAAIFIAVLGVLLALFYPAKYLVDIHWLDEKRAKFQICWLFYKKTFSFDLTEKNEDEESKEEKTKEKKETSDEGIVSKIKGMIERIKVSYPKLKKILTDEKNKEAVTHLKNEFIYLLKVLLPKKSKVDAAFSIGSPDTTGQLFGILACFPAMYQKNWRILPDFESEDIYFKGTIWSKGRIYGFQIAGIILRIVFDKNCRRLYTIINKFIKWMKNSDNAEGKING